MGSKWILSNQQNQWYENVFKYFNLERGEVLDNPRNNSRSSLVKQAERLNKKEVELNDKEKKLSKKDEEIEKKLQESIKIYNSAKACIDKNHLINSEIKLHLQELDNWKEAEEEYDSSKQIIHKAFFDYEKNKNEQNSISKLFRNVTNILKATITNVKKAYDNKINNLKEQLYGFKHFFTDKKGNACVEYCYGDNDLADMLIKTPVENFQNAINECKANGKDNFGEMIQTDGLNFLDKNFPKAQELTYERNLELEKYRERHRINTR